MRLMMKWNLPQFCRTFNRTTLTPVRILLSLPAESIFLRVPTWHSQRHTFRGTKLQFVGEMGDDYGGPSLLMIEVQGSLGIFEGQPGNLLSCYSQQLLSSNKYYTAGKLTAWSIIHNGPGP
ncbi:hypothetical protein GOODEAATRI_024173 [Goodea atripinnis]|uniref:Uncharacterized protein n=1 Tax=Goodea atripinnis TaxID=208336 RepID=A0ABV0NX87_9TELE